MLNDYEEALKTIQFAFQEAAISGCPVITAVQISTKSVRVLRAETGLSFLTCRKLLYMAAGNFDIALEEARKMSRESVYNSNWPI